MDAKTHTLQNIFVRPVRHAVPLFQRPYVWERESHWEPLVDDVLRLAEERLSGTGRDTPHFMGAIVLEQMQTPSATLETRQVIDGQQRLTTLQLLLKAARDVAAQLDAEHARQLIEELVYNRELLIGSELDHRFKVWPTYVDRDAFRAVMDPEGPPEARTDDPANTIDEAYAFFADELREWALHEGSERAPARLDLLAQVLWNGISLVVIDLGADDEAQVIFETLNARGTPLLAFDLVKNLVFRRAEAEGLALDVLHDELWSELEDRYWRALIGRGHRQRPRSEQFLLHWLTMRAGDEVPPADLFRRFADEFEADGRAGVRSFVDVFRRDAAVWKSFDEQPAGSRERLFFRRLAQMGVLTAHPLLLLLMRADQAQLEPERRWRVFQMLESWLVRRMLLKLNTRGYGKTLTGLVRVVNEDLSRADESILDWMRAQDQDATRWPRDAEVIETCVRVPMYGRQLNVTRTLLVLAGIEEGMRTAMSEEIELPPRLHVEHVLPQAWHVHWHVEGEDAAQQRAHHVHLLGNLTLVTNKLNSSLSNAPWSSKRETLNAHSVLMLNRRLVDEWPTEWNEDTIGQRSRELAEIVCRVWPGPDAWN